MNPSLRVALRLPAVLFFLLTSCFSLLSYVPFAYLQFLRHQLFEWLAFFVVFHHFLYWGAWLLGLLSIGDDLATGRRAAWIIAGIFGAYGFWLVLHPVLPALASDQRSLIIGLCALAPPLSLAAVDHLAAHGRVRWESPSVSLKSELDRPLVLCGWTAIYLWLTFAVIAGWRMSVSADPRLSRLDYALAVVWSFPLHMAVGGGLFALIAAMFAVARSPRTRYVMLMACLSGASALVLVHVVYPALAFRGWTSVAVAAVLGASAAVIWSGLALRRAADGSHEGNALNIILMSGRQKRWVTAALLALLPVVAFGAVEAVAKIDWYFLLQKLIALALWMAAIASIHRTVASSRPFFGAPIRRTLAVAMACSVLLVSGRLLAAGIPAASRWTVALDRYAAYDSSFMLLDGALSTSSTELADLTRFVVANSNIVEAQPASIDFVHPFHTSALSPSAGPRPLIFVFVVDSLRRDYLSPYNPAVHFTPGIQAFAAESLTFTRAYTRYGGTGLSEPAIWSGAMLPHKEYVTPFAPMNALEKLLTAEKYHRLISVDSILRQLLTPSPALRELDAGIQNRHYEMCRTLDEIRTALPDVIRDGRPAFVFTQPQDVHLANVAIDRERRPANAYPGFYIPYAARVKRLDACFAQFIKYLKDAGLYEQSVIVLTSDHGDSLGDEGRWGHAYTVFPEVIRIPLIVHLPASFAGKTLVDTGAVAFTTDIAPTLYTLLGHRPIDREPLFGMTLIGADADMIARRRRRPYLVASSYGPVYGVLTDNGQELYIIDGVNTAEHRYDLRHSVNGEATIITGAERAHAASTIRSQVTEISQFYRATSR